MQFLSLVGTVILQFLMHYPPLILSAELLFCIKIPKRKYFWLRIIPCSIVLCALPYFVDYFVPWLVVGWFSFSFLIYFALSMLIIWFSFDLTWQKVLYFCSSAYAVQHLFDSVQRVIATATGIDMFGVNMLWLYVLILAIVYALCYFCFARNIVKSDANLIKIWYIYCVLLFTIIIVNVLSQWMSSIGYSVLDKVYDTLICLLLLFMQLGLVHISTLVKNNLTMEDVLTKEEEQRKLSGENIEKLNIKCHDLKHQINAMMASGNSGDKQSIIEEVDDALNIYDSIFETGNTTLDVVLTEKKLMCASEKISFLCMADGKAISFMSPVDISALFGNALSNAIESVRTQTDESKRKIAVNLSRRNNLVSVHIENYCDKEIKFVDGLPVTTKSDKDEHGFGVKSMKNIVEKYGGHLRITVNDNTFSLDMLFSMSMLPQKNQ